MSGVLWRAEVSFFNLEKAEIYRSIADRAECSPAPDRHMQALRQRLGGEHASLARCWTRSGLREL